MSLCELLPFRVALALTGRSLAPDYQRLTIPVLQQFSFSQSGLVNVADNCQNVGWRTFFVGSQMKMPISEALVNNRDLCMVTLKVQEARAQYRLTDIDRYLQLNDEDSGSWSGSLKGDSATMWELLTGLNASFDLNFFGRLKNMSEAGRQNYLTTKGARRVMHILLVSNIARNHLSQRLAYAQLQIVEETLRNYQQSYAFVEKQLLTGSSNVLALEQARGVIESTHNDVARRQGELAQASNVLQLLLGSYGELPQARTVNSGNL